MTEIIEQQVISPDLTRLKNMVDNHIKVYDPFGDNSDDEHYIYQVAMETFYGKDIWKRLNSK